MTLKYIMPGSNIKPKSQILFLNNTQRSTKHFSKKSGYKKSIP